MALFLVLTVAIIDPAMAQSPQDADSGASTWQIIDILEKKGIITHEEAQRLKQRPAAEGQQPGDGAPAKTQELDRKVEQLEKKVDSQLDHIQTKTRQNERALERLETERVDKLSAENQKSSWAQRISFSGDIRLRYEGIYYDDENSPEISDPEDPNMTLNTTIDRERFRARARLGLKANIVDPRDVNVGKMEAGLRLATGNTSDPVSTNETFGDSFNKDTIVFDQYYLKWVYKPQAEWWGRIPQFSVTGGRMPNPWFSSDLVWDDDLNFEGFALNMMSDTLDENGWRLFITGGAFPLQELEFSRDDKWLYAGQVGLMAQPFYGLKMTMGAAYYDYTNLTAQFDAVGLEPGYVSPGVPNSSPPESQQWGNTLVTVDEDGSVTALVSDYNIVDLTAEVDVYYFYPVHIILGGTYAKNIGFDQEDIQNLLQVDYEIPEETDAYRLALKVGYPMIINALEWNLFYEFKRIERDAVLDAFNDSDFHLGGTNAKGWLIGFELGVYRNVWLRTRWITSDVVSGDQYAVDTLQVDINARF